MAAGVLEHRRFVTLVVDAQRSGEASLREKHGVEHLALPGVVFIPSHIERSIAETRHTPASRAAMFFLPLSLSAFYGAYSMWGERGGAIGWALLAGGVVSLALGIFAARASSRADRGLGERKYAFRKGLYLCDDGALVVQGRDDTDDDLAFYPKSEIRAVSYRRVGRRSRAELDLHAGGSVFAHRDDVCALVREWLRG